MLQLNLPTQRLRHFVGALGLALCSLASQAAITMQDDNGHSVTLAKPPLRIVSLAPHVTELLFAAGAGSKIVGAVEYSDFPEAAKHIPRVGSHSQIDLERVVALKPDLLVVWLHGGSRKQLDAILRLGIPVFQSEPRRLSDIPQAILRFGQLAGQDSTAKVAAEAFQKRAQALRQRYQNRPSVRVFYQVWDKPLYTLNGTHIVSDVLHLCGGENVFANLAPTAPVVTQEAVIAANPEVIIAGDMGSGDDSKKLNPKEQEKRAEILRAWRKFPSIVAVQRNNLFLQEADRLHRHSPRILEGATSVCEALELARQRRPHLTPTGKP